MRLDARAVGERVALNLERFGLRLAREALRGEDRPDREVPEQAGRSRASGHADDEHEARVGLLELEGELGVEEGVLEGSTQARDGAVQVADTHRRGRLHELSREHFSRQAFEHATVAVAEALPAAVAAADIVATATMSPVPVLKGEWLRPGQHLDLIGAYRADMREADDAALLRSRIFVDSFETTIAHIGELLDPIERGVIARNNVLGDLHDLVAGTVGRRSDAEITLYKNGGGAHLDLMVGREILSAWRDA